MITPPDYLKQTIPITSTSNPKIYQTNPFLNHLPLLTGINSNPKNKSKIPTFSPNTPIPTIIFCKIAIKLPPFLTIFDCTCIF